MSEVQDIKHLMPPVFDQGRRPTCLAVSTSDAHQAQIADVDRLSIEFLYYYSVISSGQIDFNGLSFVDVNQALLEKGQPKETDWLYSQVQPAANVWQPPKAIGKCFKGALLHILPDISSICSAVTKLEPVILGISVRDSLLRYQGSTTSLSTNCKGMIRGYHAVLAVGFEKKEGTRICIRNSWGAGWGIAGYGWVEEEYLMANLKYAATITRQQEIT
jgi:hypothetical protein